MIDAKYRVDTIANYVIRYSNKHNLDVSNLKLQKILYFIQAQFLVNHDRPCFGAKIEAWSFGPVVPTIYNEYIFLVVRILMLLIKILTESSIMPIKRYLIQ